MSVLAHDAGFAVAHCGHAALLTIWREPATLARLKQVREHERALADRAPRGILVLAVVTDFPFQLGSAERSESASMAREFEKSTRAMAYVVEGSGFRNSAARAAIAGIQLLSRTKHPSRGVASVEQAAAWLAPLGEPPLTATELLDALAEARAAMVRSSTGNGKG
jgi:hypothetical protein